MAILVACCNNLPSARFDVAHIYSLLLKKKYKPDEIKILSDSNISTFMKNQGIIDEKQGNLDISLRLEDELISLLKDANQTKEDLDLLIMISSHGFGNSNDEYLNFGSQTIHNDKFNFIFSNLISPKVNSLLIVDTCHSGSMMGMPYRLDNNKVIRTLMKDDIKGNIIAIAACDDNETSSDDISEFGFDGGLISCLIDNLLHNDTINIKNFFVYCQNRLKSFNQRPILSMSNPKLF